MSTDTRAETQRLGVETTGIEIIEFTYEDVRERPDYVVQVVKAHLDLARSA